MKLKSRKKFHFSSNNWIHCAIHWFIWYSLGNHEFISVYCNLKNTSLAIVAPGIAEALFATALGLLAAIPAVVAYNKFNSDSRRYFQK